MVAVGKESEYLWGTSQTPVLVSKEIKALISSLFIL